MSIGVIISALSLIKDSLPSLGKVAQRFLDGRASKEELDAEAMKHTLTADVQLALAQISVNKVEAASPSFFVAAWRPFVGWTSALGFALIVIVFPLLEFFLPNQPVPDLDRDLVVMILGGLLGLGGLRTYEKTKGVNRA